MPDSARVILTTPLARKDRIVSSPLVWLVGFFSFQNVYAVQSLLPLWLRDFHVDGLRLDAVHAIVDTRAMHLLEEMSRDVETLATQTNRPLFLVAESDLNDPRLVSAREAGGYGLTAQWADDPHHALHAALTGERQGYYCDFGSLATLAKAMESPYHHAGTWSTFRGRTPLASPPATSTLPSCSSTPMP